MPKFSKNIIKKFERKQEKRSNCCYPKIEMIPIRFARSIQLNRYYILRGSPGIRYST